MTTRSVLINARHVLLVTAASFALAAQAQTSSPNAPAAQPAQKEAAPAQAAFQRADANKDGRLSKEEAARMPAISTKFGELDTDKDGNLSLSEFAQGYMSDK